MQAWDKIVRRMDHCGFLRRKREPPPNFPAAELGVGRLRRRPPGDRFRRLLLLSAGRFQNESRNRLRLRDEREMARLTSIVLAPIRFAMKRSRSGLIMRSSVETA
jgi:hypothetical protein